MDRSATSDTLGKGGFLFSDRYSVFDWGEMPDRIPDKGAGLCIMGAYHFEQLEAENVPTHYRGVRSGEDSCRLDAVDAPPTRMDIDLTRVPELPFSDGTYDYEQFHENGGENYLIPLEIVFRNRIPVGSSLRQRTEPEDHGMDYETWPDKPLTLESPVVEFSTKFEEKDRYLSRDEARSIAGRARLDRLTELAHRVNEIITRCADRAGFVHEDGKIECLFFRGDIRVADVVGTFDENRFRYEDHPISKEVIRQFYKSFHPEWVKACNKARKEAKQRQDPDWRKFCDVRPRPLPSDVLQVIRDLYAAGTNAYTDRDWFEAPPLSEALEATQNLS